MGELPCTSQTCRRPSTGRRPRTLKPAPGASCVLLPEVSPLWQLRGGRLCGSETSASCLRDHCPVGASRGAQGLGVPMPRRADRLRGHAGALGQIPTPFAPGALSQQAPPGSTLPRLTGRPGPGRSSTPTEGPGCWASSACPPPLLRTPHRVRAGNGCCLGQSSVEEAGAAARSRVSEPPPPPVREDQVRGDQGVPGSRACMGLAHRGALTVTWTPAPDCLVPMRGAVRCVPGASSPPTPCSHTRSAGNVGCRPPGPRAPA